MPLIGQANSAGDLVQTVPFAPKSSYSFCTGLVSGRKQPRFITLPPPGEQGLGPLENQLRLQRPSDASAQEQLSSLHKGS